MHTYMNTYTPTYIHTYIHTYMHTYIHIYIHIEALRLSSSSDVGDKDVVNMIVDQKVCA